MIFVQLTEMLLSVRTPNINDLNNSITGAVKVVIDKHVLIRTASRNKQKQLSKPWITKSILKSRFLSNDPAEIAEFKKKIHINSIR